MTSHPGDRTAHDLAMVDVDPSTEPTRKGAPMRTTISWLSDEAIARSRSKGIATGDRGEGVISAAIAVLIMAFLGAAMWIGFNKMWKDTESTTSDKVQQIGR